MKVWASFLAVPWGTLKQRELKIDVPLGTTVGELLGRLAEETPVLRRDA